MKMGRKRRRFAPFLIIDLRLFVDYENVDGSTKTSAERRRMKSPHISYWSKAQEKDALHLP